VSSALILGTLVLSVYQGRLIASGQGSAALGQMLLLPAFAILALVRPSWAVLVYFGFRALPDIPVGSLPGLNVMTFGTLTLAFAAVARLALVRRRIPSSTLWLPMLCMYFMFWVSACYYLDSWGIPQLQIVKDLVGMATGPILFFYLMGSDLQRRDVLTIFGGLILLWCVTVGHVLMLGTSGYLRDPTEFSAYVHRSDAIDYYYPATLIVALSLALAALRLAPIELNRWRWLLSFLLAGGAAAQLMSSFLSATVGLLFALAVTLLLTRLPGQKRLGIAGNMAITFFLIIILLPVFTPAVSLIRDKLFYRLTLEGFSIIPQGPFATRISLWWPLAWAEFLRHPIFGLGWNNSWRLQNGPFNLLLFSLSLFGLVGSVFVAWFLLTLLRFLRLCLRSFEHDTFWATIAIGAFAGLIGNLIFFMGEDGFFGSWSNIFYLLAALLTKAQYEVLQTTIDGSGLAGELQSGWQMTSRGNPGGTDREVRSR